MKNSTRFFKGVASVTALVFFLTFSIASAQVPPKPPPPSQPAPQTDDGGSSSILPIIGGVLVVAAIGYLVKWWKGKGKGPKKDIAHPNEGEVARMSEEEASRPNETDVAHPNESDVIGPNETDVTRLNKSDMAHPDESDVARSSQGEATPPNKSDLADPNETDVTRSNESDEIDEQNGFVANQVIVTVPLPDTGTVAALGESLAKTHGLILLETHPLISIRIVTFVFSSLDKINPIEKATQLSGEASVLFAQPHFIYKTQADDLSPSEVYGYGPRLINADRLHPLLTGKGVTVALIDTGVDVNHPTLKGKILEAIDFTGNQFTPDIHGTVLAGIIAATSTEIASGIVGVAPDVQLIAIKGCHPPKPDRIEAFCRSTALAQGLDMALQKGARVINMSVGGKSSQDRLVARLLDEAVRQGRIVVAAAGNDGAMGAPTYPAADENVMAVTAVDAMEQIYPQATQGSFIDLSAPGVQIVGIAPNNQTRVVSGTSFAAGFVSGVVALMLQNQPALSFREIQTRLLTTAKDLGPAGKDPRFGSGLIDACRAVETKDRASLCAPPIPK